MKFIAILTAEEWTAVFTLALVVVGAITAAVLICQSILLRQQVQAAREEFIASHPPKLVVRRFQFRVMKKNEPPLIEFVVANEGRSEAKIVFSNVTAKILPLDQMKNLEENSFPIYEGSLDMLKKTVYAPGEREAQALVLHGIKDTKAAIEGINAGTLGLACFGFIKYEDALHVAQETRFFRTRRDGEKFLVAHTDPDYENS